MLSRLTAWMCLLLALAIIPPLARAQEKKAEPKAKKTSKEKGLGKSEAHVKYPEFENVRLLTLKVEAGDVDRLDTPVSVELPANVNGFRAVRLVEVVEGQPRPVPMQVEAMGPGRQPRLWLTLAGKTPSGATRTYELWPGDPVVGEAVKIELGGQTLDVSFGGGKLFSYHHAHVVPPSNVSHDFIRSGYINPMFSPSGTLLTEDFPADHYHHKGIWFPWTNIEYEGHRVDTWNLGDRSGQVQFAGFTGVASGGVFGQFRAAHQMLDVSQQRPAGKVMIDETWDVKVYAQGGPRGGYWLFDLASTQRTATDVPVKLPEYRYGGIAYRGPKNWNNDNYVLLTSEGHDKKTGHTTRARWCAHSGATDGKWSTVVLMGHPTNFRFPEPQRIWEKGGAFFNFAPSQAGDWTIEPGRDYVWRYRFYVYDGPIDKDRIERAWQDFGNPPRVSVSQTR